MESNSYNISQDERQQLIDSIPTVKVVDSCKENIEPRKSGRSVASLTTLFETNPNEREREIALKRKKFEEQLDTVDEQDDPLDIFIQHLNWTHAMFPQGQSSESNFVGLLSDVTNRFKTDPRYKSDPRYLKLWIEYSHYVDEPIKIFNLLIHEEIGQALALFYEEYSAYFERTKKMKEAVEVYEKGIQVSAQPIKRLQKNLIHLKTRINERQQRGMLKKEQNEAKAQLNELRQHGRTMLGHKFDSRSRSSVSANVFSNITAASASSSSSSATSSLPSSLARSRTFGNDRPLISSRSSSPTQSMDEMSSPSSSFSVYVETPAPTSTSTNIFSRSSTSSQHPIITPQHQQKIENQHTVEKFSGATLPQAEIVSEPIEPFQVYQDDTTTTTTNSNSAAPQQQHQIRSLERSDSMLSISTGEESAVSKIRRNPTSDYPSNSTSSTSNNNKRLKSSHHHQLTESEKRDWEIEKKFNKEMGKKFIKNREIYVRSKNSKGGAEYITMSKSIPREMSVEEYRVQMMNLSTAGSLSEGDGWSDYKKQIEKERKCKVLPDLTTETIAAMKSVSELFDEKDAYEEEEQDLTWTNPVQKFATTYRPPANENE